MTPGTRLGPYEITAALGVGGMGEVYRARDTKLNRDVAIKVLPDLLAHDPERRARFEREAQALAALNHPHIAQIYGVQEDGGFLALVMELVEGPTLADLIGGAACTRLSSVAESTALASRMGARGLPVEEAIRIASQVTEALEDAHAAGIVHRDLKPANIKVRPDGVVKVLDFGLARMAGPDPLGSTAAANSPTYVSPGATAHGVIIGTAAYMAPEQARGHVADARSDLWAFGVVLFEMLTGAPLFQGATVSDVLASVLRDPPKWETLPPETPPRVQRVLRQCLQKDPQLRLRNAGDARLELLDDDVAAVAPPRSLSARRWRPVLMGALVGGAIIAAVLVPWIVGRRPTPDAQPLRKWSIPRDGSADTPIRWNLPAISPDARRLAYLDGRTLRIRDLSALDSPEVPVPGVATWAAWAPDSSFVVFTVDKGDSLTLWRVAAAGGVPSKVCDLPHRVMSGLVVQADQTVIVNLFMGRLRGGLFKVDARGGVPQPIAANTGDESSIVFLSALPDGALTYLNMQGSQSETVVEGGGRPRSTLALPAHYWMSYAPSGHLLFARQNESGIWAVPFNLATHTLRGEPFRIVNYGIGPTVSSDGTIAYGQDLAGLQQLTWVDRDGTVGTPIGEPQAAIIGLKLSPDGTRVAVGGQEGQEVGRTNIWVHDVARGTKVKVTSGNSDCCPVWHPREPRLAFMHLDDWSIRSVNADAGEDAAIMARGDDGASFVPNWPLDGRFLLFSRFSPDTQDDIWMLRAGATTPVPVIRGPAKESGGSLSPDGRYITYWSDESGAYEILVREFPSGQGRLQVSVGGGTSSYWSPKGDEIFYVHEQQLMSARVRTGPALQIDAPRPLFRLERTTGGFDPSFDTLDGRRFVVVRTLKPAQSTVVVVQNWFEEFRRK